MRRFVLIRDVDVSGISGEGVIVWGIQYPDGYVAYRWNTATATTCLANNIGDVERIHGHGGATRLVWLDTVEGGLLWRALEVLSPRESPAPVSPPREAGPVVASPTRERR